MYIKNKYMQERYKNIHNIYYLKETDKQIQNEKIQMKEIEKK